MKNVFLNLSIALALLCTTSCSQKNKEEVITVSPGESLGIESVPNFRDLGGYRTSDGKLVKNSLVYRSNQLSGISSHDMAKIEELGLKNDFDLRTKDEAAMLPDEKPEGVNYIFLDVLADVQSSSDSAVWGEKLKSPKAINEKLGNGKIDSMFLDTYKNLVNMPSAQASYRKLFLSLTNPENTPILFHCTTGKDRTGWAAAALLSLLGVSNEDVVKDYLKSNEYIIPMYRKQIDEFIAAGGDSLIPLAIFGVKKEYLNTSFTQMKKNYGSIENYFSKGLGIDQQQQKAIRELLLTEK